MKRRLLIAAGMVSVMSMSVGAQQLHSDYITWPSSAHLQNYVNAWEKGKSLTQTWDGNGTASEWEDEEFFTSRVKLKPYIRNAATQVKNITETSDKNLLFWVPVGYDNLAGLKTNALPNGLFDSEVFSMWPYVTHYGNWTSPHGWVPGGFADAAHKHGTAVSGVASIPNAALSGNWLTCITQMGNMASDDTKVQKLGDFLAYHGVDGLGYNSEYSVNTSVQNNLNNLHSKLEKYMTGTKKCVKFENPWYAAVSNAGQINFMSALHSNNTYAFGDSVNLRTIYFINYEWYSYLSTTNATIKTTGRKPQDLYMGMNMQASCKSSREWLNHATHNYSIGLWGAHDFNYIWNRRSAEGSSNEAKQRTYQKHIEQWFTNGNRNPANRIEPFQTSSLSPSDNWMGMSSYMTARSTLGWDLSTEPFITFFNLGNGKFFNWKGERQNNNEWYNIGVQDYMPTWRFWWATELLGGTKDKVAANGLKAEFTWEDAWMGGSCLRIHGTSANEYLHLFKTQFTLKRNDVITVRYKLLDGSAKVSLIITNLSAESTPLRESDLNVFTTETIADDGLWVEKSVKLTSGLGSALNNKTVALVGLHFENAANLDMYLGEFSIKRGTYGTPVKPEITKSKLLNNNYKGVDGKLIWKVANSKATGEPVYNTDVNTSVFKVWAKSGSEEPAVVGMTSSWAAIAYSAPIAENASSIQLGVSAVSMDFTQESDIAWASAAELPEYKVSDEISIDKTTITPDESFKISFVDPLHPVASWKLVNQEGTEVASATGVTTFDVPDGLSEIGGYNLIINAGTDEETTYEYYVQISNPIAGKLPEIKSLTIDNEEVTSDGNPVQIKVNDELTLGYTGREADGTCTRAVALNNALFGVSAAELGLGSNKSFSVATWVKFTSIPTGISNLLTIETRSSGWPKNTWGFFWSRIAGDGTLCYNKIDGCWGMSLDSDADGYRLYSDYKNVKFSKGAWYHLVWVFDYDTSGKVSTSFYVNGVKQTMTTWGRVLKSTREGKGTWDDLQSSIDAGATTTDKGTNSTETGYVSQSYALGESNWIAFGGGSTAADINCVDGSIDDFQIWNKAMTQDDVNASMAGLDGDNLPEGVVAFWDFETDSDINHAFLAKGSKANVHGYWFDRNSGEAEGTATPAIGPAYFTPGPASLPGNAFKVETVPTWTARKGVLSEATGGHTSGSTKLTYPTGREGDYNVKLSLDNSYGSHAMEYPMIQVSAEPAAIGSVEADGTDFAVSVEGSVVVLEFAADGSYGIDVYNTAGLLLNSKKTDILAGQNVSVSLATAGVYMVRVTKDGKLLRTVKVLRK